MESNELHIQTEDDELLLVIERKAKSTSLRNVFFAFLVILGTFGLNVTLPLWIDSGKPSNYSTSTKTDSSSYKPFMDSYFVSVLSAFILAVFYGLCFAVRLLKAFLAGESYDRRISHKLVFLAGFLNGFSCLLTFFASSGKRTAPYLQAVLLNATIPSTLVLRYFILKKPPTKRKLICALTTLFSLFVCLLPSIVPEIDPNNGHDKEQGGAVGWQGIFWPLCFMLGYMLTALMYIVSEKVYQYQHNTSANKVDLVYIFFLNQLSRFITGSAFFWVDAIPAFGNVDSIEKVYLNFWFGLQCCFGHGGCSLYPGLYMSLFVISYIIYYAGAACLLRYSEGATFLAIITAIVTPTGFLFWTLFKEQPSFHWHPEMNITVWLNIVGLIIMVPSIYFYNVEGTTHKPKCSDERDMETTSPLLVDHQRHDTNNYE